MLKYLRSSGKNVALLLNFGLPSLEYRRFVRGYESSQQSMDETSPAAE